MTLPAVLSQRSERITLNEDLGRAAQEVLGYLNFSSGSFDPKFLRNVNHLFQAALARNPGTTAWLSVRQILEARLTALEGSSAAFADVNQARQVLALAGDHALPEYRRFHRDLLFHQTDDFLFQPLFVGRVFEAVLRQGPPWSECERITSATIRELNDFVGYRPVAILNTAAKIEPYPHERVRPIPIYIAGVGPGAGPYAKLIARAIDILNSTDRALLRETQLDPALIDELAVYPRAYDFDHPVNKRTNYQFGEWDPHVIDNRGHYRRFVLRQLTLDTILSRVAEAEPAGDDFLFEGAAVLAGVMLMASGMTGNGPEAHDSSVTLATLIPRIAKYRDAFYEKLLESLSGELSDRLRGEAQRLHQPFAGARQHLNYQIARYRAEQLQRMALAALFARMGYPDAARRQTRLVPVASARMKCEMTIRFTAASQAIERGALAQAATLRDEIEDLAHRGIECGALVDPWNILGFQGNFSIFPAIENTVRDHRVDELINLVRQIL